MNRRATIRAMGQKRPRKDAPARVWTRHPLYGQIPMIAHRRQDQPRGGWYYTYDLDYQPGLPAGAIRGNPHKQHLCFWHNAPMYFYVDQPRTCAQCGVAFVFTAREQKHWYEALGFYGTSVPVRCLACRRRRRTAHALEAQIGAAKAAVRVNPADAAAHLALAEALVRYRQRTGRGDLGQAIAAARRVCKLAPRPPEALFWEGMAQIEAGRRAAGQPLLTEFARTPGNSARHRKLVKEACALLGS